MDFLEFDRINEIQKQKLIELAYDRYYFDLEELYFYECLTSPFKGNSFKEGKKILDIMLTERIPQNTNGFNKNDNTSPFLLEYNQANFDELTCYKLLLCSRSLSFSWYIPYDNLYKYFYDVSKHNKDIDIDIFIGKINELFEQGNDIQFNAFEKLTSLKYKKIKLEEI